jgi:hypothetical protein
LQNEQLKDVQRLLREAASREQQLTRDKQELEEKVCLDRLRARPSMSLYF